MFGWSALSLLVAAAIAIVAVPVVLIRPFVPQTPESLSVAFTLRRWSPAATLLALGGALALGWLLGRSATRRWQRIVTVLLMMPVLAAAWLSRQNHFEWMFAPLPDARFVRAEAAGFMRPDDMVLAVSMGGDPVAYPVPQLAYHHLVEDEVGKVPIVVTY